MSQEIQSTCPLHWLSEGVRLNHFLCTLLHTCHTVSKYIENYAVSFNLYLNHSQDQKNGEGNESGSHLVSF